MFRLRVLKLSIQRSLSYRPWHSCLLTFLELTATGGGRLVFVYAQYSIDGMGVCIEDKGCDVQNMPKNTV